ncbi:MAG TPA: 3-methyl-2-oxobutanoate dehydrogenase subunit VorB [Candidatus Sumerlaeota bacterium]|nr:3-methyl-2-oxobutanoate dehydrogenase subunit VorB [Candidatus Sumerlaeota bacterium]
METERKLLMGNEAVGLGAILAGCRYYFGYPITPQNELTEYMAHNIPAAGGSFIQSESELAAINMVTGAAAAGARAMTSSSSPGISLMQEGISYMAGMEVPAVIVNVVRGGPGLGGIGPAQSDYFQSVKGGGHGDYHTIVLAPHIVQEMMDFTMRAFDLADEYRMPVLVLSDGLLGQMSETVDIPCDFKPRVFEKPWAMTGCAGREPNEVRSLFLDPAGLELHNQHLFRKYDLLKREAVCEEFMTEDAEFLIAAYGISGRICKAVVEQGRREGIRIGLLRPITLYPLADAIIRDRARIAKNVLVVELSMGQFVEDVRRIVGYTTPVHFTGRTGGMVFSADDIMEKVRSIHFNQEGNTP